MIIGCLGQNLKVRDSRVGSKVMGLTPVCRCVNKAPTQLQERTVGN